MPRTCVLKAEGKVVTVQTFRDGLKMCAIDCQASKQKHYKAHICERRIQEDRLMALHFPRKQSYYWIKVVDNQLMVEKTASEKNPEQISDDYWFVMKNNGGGEEYSLNPLVAPRVWLALLSDPPYKFTLSEHAQESVQVSAESI